jgi:hypothetical protein
MTYLTQRILRSHFLNLVLISLVLIALQAIPARAQWTANGNNINNTNSGNVGIGTSNPDKLLTVQGSVPFVGVLAAIRTTGPYNGFGLLLDATGGGNNNLGLAIGGAVKANFAFDSRGFLGFMNAAYSNNDFGLRLNSDGSLSFHDALNYPSSERFRITAAGNVGIGITNPSEKLAVLGNVNVTGTGTDTGNITAAGTITAGNIKAKYQDVAEWVPASEQIPAGTVVVLDPTKSNHVIASTKAYDTRVAGVISDQPGIALGDSGNGKVLVATTGRVKIKVDATRSPIHVGDLLVTSHNPGMAMKSQPLTLGGVQIHRPGTLIGKALEPLAKGTGEILVLLSLQ